MDEVTISSFGDLNSKVENLEGFTIWRGVKNATYEAIPAIGRREELLETNIYKLEADMLKVFREQSVPHLDFTPANQWEWLAIAQHYGLPTRLLDWSRNPLVATYFAVEDEGDEDGAVYSYTPNDKTIDVSIEPDPFSVITVRVFRPSHITRRIIAQTGFFTIHPHPKAPLVSENMSKIVIPSSLKTSLKLTLAKYGITRATLFPDLDGVAAYIKWLARYPS